MRKPYRQTQTNFGSKQVSAAALRAQAIGLVVNAKVLPTAESLARMYRMKPDDAAKVLEDERARRSKML